MTITVDVTSEVRAEVTRPASAQGRGLEAYAASLLARAAQVSGASPLNQDRLKRTLREMSQFSDKIPVLPDETFTRESLYRDHD